MQKYAIAVLAAVLALGAAGNASALTIWDIQFSAGPDYVSPYVDQTVDVAGGVVTKVFVGGSTKVTIQDPTLGGEWAGIQLVFSDPAQAEGISEGDQIDVFGAVVGEYRGNTQLNMGAASSFVVNSTGNVVTPLVVSVADIPAEVDHDRSEKYEFMLLTVLGVQVGQMDLGKNSDDYELVNNEGVCWASDYANSDLPPGQDYYVQPGESFDAVTGYLEQYLRLDQGWDYYQLLPRSSGDYVPAGTPAQETTWGGIKARYH